MSAATLIAPLAAGITGAASGTAEIYARGTTTPVNAYSDAEATAVIGKILPLDANGGTEAYATEPVFVRVRSYLGAVVREFTLQQGDNDVDVASSSFTGLLPTGSQGAGGLVDLKTVLDRWYASAQSLDFKVRRAGVTVPQTLQDAFAAVTASNLPFFNVVNYGASGDGVTTNDAAFLACHNAAVSAGGGIILVPGGNFLLASAFAITSPKVSMMGFGARASVITSGLAAGVAITVNAGTATACGSFIRDIQIAAFTSGANTTPLQVVSTPGLLLQNLTVSAFALAVDIQSTVTVQNCNWNVPTSATAGDYVAKFAGSADDSIIVGGSFTQARATNTGALSLARPNIAVLGSRVDISAASGASYGVDVTGAACRVQACGIVTGVAASYGLRVNADANFAESDNFFAGSGKTLLLASALAKTTRVWAGSRVNRYNTKSVALVGSTDMSLDPSYEVYYITVTAASGGPFMGINFTPLNLVHHGARFVVVVTNNSGVSWAIGSGSAIPATSFIAANLGTVTMAAPAGSIKVLSFIYDGTPGDFLSLARMTAVGA